MKYWLRHCTPLHVAYNFSSHTEKGLLKVKRSHTDCKSGNISLMAHDRDIVTTDYILGCWFSLYCKNTRLPTNSLTLCSSELLQFVHLH